MLVGLKGKGREIFRFLHALPVNIKSFTIVEILVSALILSVITAGLFMVLNIGEFSNSVSSSKLGLQEKTRRVINWITKDVRQTVGSEIANNDPSSSHIKFKLCLGHDGVSRQLSSYYIEYTYDGNLDRLTRTDHNTAQTWNFDNIIAEPFDTSALADNVLGITITTLKQRAGLPDISCSLSSRIKIRNE